MPKLEVADGELAVDEGHGAEPVPNESLADGYATAFGLNLDSVRKSDCANMDAHRSNVASGC